MTNKFLMIFIISSLVFVSFTTSYGTSDVGFRDLSRHHWSYGTVMEAVNNGVISGYQTAKGKEFRPENNVTNAEFIKMAVIIATGKDPGIAPEGEMWAKNYYREASYAGLLDNLRIGTSYNVTLLNHPITRQDAVLLISNIINNDAESFRAEEMFSDVSKDTRSFTSEEKTLVCSAIGEVHNAGIMCGYPDSTFKLKNLITRAEAAVVMVNLMKGGTASLSAEEFKDEVVRLVNIERRSLGIQALEVHERLGEVVDLRAEEIAVLFSHDRPNGSDYLSMVDEYGFDYRAFGENIAAGYNDPETLIKAWMSSTGHRENILRSGFRNIGIGYHKDASGTVYAVQWFYTPLT